VNVPLTQGMISAYLQLLQVQTQTGKQKLEYMRRREEREEKESVQRRDIERARMERETAEFEHNKQSTHVKQRADRAIVSRCCRFLGALADGNPISGATGEFCGRCVC
jgi:hypothetical protein